MYVRATFALLVAATLLGSVTPGFGQTPEDSVAVLVATLSHFPEITHTPVPEGRIAVDSMNFEPRRHLDAVAQELGATVTTRRAVCQERLARGRCNLRASGHAAIVRARSLAMTGDSAKVVADISWDVRVGVEYLQVAFDLVRRNGEWEVVASKVLVEGHG